MRILAVTGLVTLYLGASLYSLFAGMSVGPSGCFDYCGPMPPLVIAVPTAVMLGPGLLMTLAAWRAGARGLSGRAGVIANGALALVLLGTLGAGVAVYLNTRAATIEQYVSHGPLQGTPALYGVGWAPQFLPVWALAVVAFTLWRYPLPLRGATRGLALAGLALMLAGALVYIDIMRRDCFEGCPERTLLTLAQIRGIPLLGPGLLTIAAAWLLSLFLLRRQRRRFVISLIAPVVALGATALLALAEGYQINASVDLTTLPRWPEYTPLLHLPLLIWPVVVSALVFLPLRGRPSLGAESHAPVTPPQTLPG